MNIKHVDSNKNQFHTTSIAILQFIVHNISITFKHTVNQVPSQKLKYEQCSQIKQIPIMIFMCYDHGKKNPIQFQMSENLPCCPILTENEISACCKSFNQLQTLLLLSFPFANLFPLQPIAKLYMMMVILDGNLNETRLFLVMSDFWGDGGGEWNCLRFYGDLIFWLGDWKFHDFD